MIRIMLLRQQLQVLRKSRPYSWGLAQGLTQAESAKASESALFLYQKICRRPPPAYPFKIDGHGA
eukprot:2666673-Rhodomonas_salina.2